MATTTGTPVLRRVLLFKIVVVHLRPGRAVDVNSRCSDIKHQFISCTLALRRMPTCLQMLSFRRQSRLRSLLQSAAFDAIRWIGRKPFLSNGVLN